MTKIIYLGNQLSKHGFTPTSVETLGERLKESFEVVQASSMKNQLLRLVHMWWKVVRHRKASYLLVDTYSTSAFLFAWTCARIAEAFNIKYVPILRGGSLPEKAKQSPKLLKRLLNQAATVVCPSGYLKTEMENIIGGQYLIIPNYIDIANYPYQEKQITAKTGIKLFWLRSFHEIYNPYLAVKVLHALKQKTDLNVELCMVGPDKDGSMEKVRQLAEELGVAAALKTPGRLSKKDWIALSANYNIFLNTTNVDNTPVSVMEAMALGFPVITTNVGGIPYLFEHQEEGIMVEPNDVDVIVNTVQQLLEHPEMMQQLGRNARAKAESWDWQVVKQQWKQVLQ